MFSVRSINERDIIRKTLASQYEISDCLLYTSDAADERSSVDLGGRRIIKKKIGHNIGSTRTN